MKLTSENTALASRQVAFDALQAITRNGMVLDLAFEQALASTPGLDVRDRAYARQLLSTTLRRIPALDKLLNQNMDRPLGERDISARNWLRLGLAQLLFMGTEDRAAVHTTVELMGQSPENGVRKKKGLANAVLRNMGRTKDAKLKQVQNPLSSLAPWLRKRWSKHYGNETVQAIAAVLMNDPPTDITLKPGENSEKWAAELGGVALGAHNIRLAKAGDISALPGFQDGKWWVQDIAASLPAQLLGNVADKDAADLCAAPGGKTLQLAAAGAHVIAVDQSGQRLARLRQNLDRTGLKAQVVEADVLDWVPGQMFDAILLDAPCSATGTMRRHPDTALHKSGGDITALANLQAKLLARAYELLKPGGVLVYCTCSMEPEEGEDIIRNFLQGEKTAKRAPVAPTEIDPAPAIAITDDGDVRTLPHMSLSNQVGMDGFFMARITRKA